MLIRSCSNAASRGSIFTLLRTFAIPTSRSTWWYRLLDATTRSATTTPKRTLCCCLSAPAIMASGISIPDWIVEHIAVAIELLRITRPATALAPRSRSHRIAWRNRQRARARNDRVCRNKPSQVGIVITGSIVCQPNRYGVGMRLAGAGWIAQMERYGGSSISIIVARGCGALRRGSVPYKARY